MKECITNVVRSSLNQVQGGLTYPHLRYPVPSLSAVDVIGSNLQ